MTQKCNWNFELEVTRFPINPDTPSLALIQAKTNFTGVSSTRVWAMRSRTARDFTVKVSLGETLVQSHLNICLDYSVFSVFQHHHHDHQQPHGWTALTSYISQNLSRLTGFQFISFLCLPKLLNPAGRPVWFQSWAHFCSKTTASSTRSRARTGAERRAAGYCQ